MSAFFAVTGKKSPSVWEGLHNLIIRTVNTNSLQ